MITKQEMFDRAVRGLSAQGWKQAKEGDHCTYQAPDGKRCAWGHVDLSLTGNDPPIGALFDDSKGLFQNIENYDEKYKTYRFGKTMQALHDDREWPHQMLQSFICLGERFNLTWPADVPKELP